MNVNDWTAGPDTRQHAVNTEPACGHCLGFAAEKRDNEKRSGSGLGPATASNPTDRQHRNGRASVNISPPAPLVVYGGGR